MSSDMNPMATTAGTSAADIHVKPNTAKDYNTQ